MGQYLLIKCAVPFDVFARHTQQPSKATIAKSAHCLLLKIGRCVASALFKWQFRPLISIIHKMATITRKGYLFADNNVKLMQITMSLFGIVIIDQDNSLKFDDAAERWRVNSLTFSLLKTMACNYIINVFTAK